MRQTAIILSLLLALQTALAQRVMTLDSRQGLPDNSVNCLAEDSVGFIWVGTANGLCRYDGVAFTIFKHRANDSGSIANDNIHTILSVKDGLYVSTDEGVDFYSYRTGQFQHLIPDDGLKDVRMNAMIETDGQALGTVEDGRLYVLNENSMKVVKNGVHTFSIAKTGSAIFAVGNQEVCLLSADGKKVISRLPVDIRGSYTTNIYQSRLTGLVYVGNGIGSKSQVFRIRRNRIEAVSEAVPDGLRAAVDYDGQTVFGTDGQGVKPLGLPLSGDAVYSLLVDRSDNLWVGTYRTGLNLIINREKHFSCLPMDMVTAITGVGDNLYIGLDGGGLCVYNIPNRQSRFFTSSNSQLPGNNITSIATDGDDVWLAVYNHGLVRYSIATGTFRNYSIPESDSSGDLIWTICDDDNGNIWTGGRDVNVFSKKFESFTCIDKLKGNQSQYLYSSGNVVWVANDHGVYKLDARTKKIIGYFHKNSQPIALADNKVKLVFTDASGALWIAYKHSGVSRIDETSQSIRHFEARHGVPDQPITAIEDGKDGRLVMSTANGLYEYAPKTESFIRIENRENVPSFFNYGASWSDGQIFYFGSTKGVVAFSPMKADSQASPKVSLTSIVLTGGETFNLNETYRNSIRLDYDQNFFTIHYTVPEYQFPHSVRFSYFMKGLEDDWREMTDERDAAYTSIPPGKYEFMVRSMGSNGQWTDPTVLYIKVSPPWYLSWWATIVWGLLAIAVVYAAVRTWLHNQRIRHQMELTEVEKEAERRLNDAKTNFYTSIVHELRTPVFLITAQLEEMLEGAKDVAKIPTVYLASLHRNAVRLNNIISRIIDFRKIGAENLELNLRRNDVTAFCHSLTSTYTDMFRQKNIEYELKVPDGELLLDYDPLKLELIISNLITNAFKYTKDGGRVVFAVEDGADRVTFSVKDNGIGIDERYRDTIFESFFRSERGKKQSSGDGLGLSYVKHLVELHHGEIKVESQMGKGTEFVFYIPKQETTAKALPTVKAKTAEHKANPAASHTILIIDDEQDTVDLLERALEKDFKIVKAYDGDEGLKMAGQTLPDIILCDIMMPKMDGLAFLKALRSDKKLRHVKVIIFTAETSEEDMLTAFDYKADAYLVKPISLKLLRKRIDRLIDADHDDRLLTEHGSSSQATPSHSKEEQMFLLRCREVIDDNLKNPDFNINFLADALTMSHSALYKKLKALTGMSLIEFINDYRIYKAVQLIRQGETNIETVAELCGVNDPKNFRTLFKRKMGMTPKQFVQSL